MKIQLSKIDYNPYRDIELDPIEESRVAMMRESVAELGFWGGIAVRKVGDRYQLAFGHHRLEALRRPKKKVNPHKEVGLGMKYADLNVVEYDEDQMARAMIEENLTQRGGESGGCTDGVAAAIRRLGFILMTTDSERLGNFRSVFSSKAHFGNAKAAFLDAKEGRGIGAPLICKYRKTFKPDDVESALSTIKTSGHYAKILKRIADDLLNAGYTDEGEEVLYLFASELKKNPGVYDPLADLVFKRTSHSDTFREFVTQPQVNRIFPRETHVTLAKSVVSAIENNEHLKVTSATIYDRLRVLYREARGMADVGDDKADIHMVANSQLRKLMSFASSMEKAMETLEECIKEGAVLTEDPAPFLDVTVPSLCNQLEGLAALIITEDQIVANQ